MIENFEALFTHGPWATLAGILLYRIFKKNDQSNNKYEEIILENQRLIDKQLDLHKDNIEVIKDSQEVIRELSNKYDDIKENLKDMNVDIRQIYRKVCENQSCGSGGDS